MTSRRKTECDQSSQLPGIGLVGGWHCHLMPSVVPMVGHTAAQLKEKGQEEQAAFCKWEFHDESSLSGSV